MTGDLGMPAPAEMVDRAVGDMAALGESLLAAIETAERVDDRTRTNLLDEIHDGLEGHLWMLKA